MKIAKLWRKGNIVIVKKEQENYMPEHYGKGAICINDHWVYKSEDIKLMIKKVSKSTEQAIKALQYDKELLRKRIEEKDRFIQMKIDREFQND